MAGLDDVKAFNFLHKKPMNLYADSLTEEALRRDFYYAFTDTKYPGIPELNLNTINLPRARSREQDHVRPDDGRLVDLHLDFQASSPDFSRA